MSFLRKVSTIVLTMSPLLSRERVYQLRLFPHIMPFGTIGTSRNAASIASTSKQLDNTAFFSTVSLLSKTVQLGQAVDGALAFDDPTYTDETTEANDATTNDCTLAPASAVTGDGFLVGGTNRFDGIIVQLDTVGVGTYTITMKYWNGSAWSDLTIKYNELPNWRPASTRKGFIEWTGRPGDWALRTLESLELYWVFAYITMGTMTTVPKASQIWILEYP